ncbi:MAG: beta-propeller fold lactonase family protein [Eubacteriales bacterium]
MTFAYIASAKPLAGGGGIFIFRDENGELVRTGFVPCDVPSYMTISDGRLYLISRGSDDHSFVTVFDIAPDGSLFPAADHIPTNGGDGCHIAVSDGDIYCANYGSGSLCRITEDGGAYKNVRTVEHFGRSIRADRQTRPYVHSVTPTPDGFFAACDLGCDRIAIYDRALCHIRDFYLPAGFGPRHMVFSADGSHAFCIGELGVAVSALRYCGGGSFEALETYDLLPAGFPADARSLNTGAAVKLSPDGRFIAATARYANTFSLFSVSGGALARLGIYPCGGDWPRDISYSPDGKRLYCCLERSDRVSVYSLGDDMKPRADKSIGGIAAPLCAVFALI